MSDKLQTYKSTFAAIEEAAKTVALGAAEPRIAHALDMAVAMQTVRDALSQQVVESVLMPLMNSRLGFRTDKDPTKPVWNKQTGGYTAPKPYDWLVVREAAIEAMLRGLAPVGNQFNIVAGSCYVTKEGFLQLLKRAVSDYREKIGQPQWSAAASNAKTATNDDARLAVVTVRADWTQGGKPDFLEAEIPIRVNTAMGIDAVMGKAESKLRRRVWAQLSGQELPEGDADEPRQATGRVVEEDAPKGLPPKKAKEPAKEPAPEQPKPVISEAGDSARKGILGKLSALAWVEDEFCLSLSALNLVESDPHRVAELPDADAIMIDRGWPVISAKIREHWEGAA